MYSLKKIFLLSLTSSFLVGCQEDETLNLKDFPTPVVSISVLNSDNPVLGNFVATYQPDGQLAIENEPAVKISLERPYIDDVVVNLDYTLENLSSDSYDFPKQIKIPAGKTESSFTLDNLAASFDSFDKMTYGVGIKAAQVKVGGDAITCDATADIRIDKEAFSSAVSFEGEAGNDITFTRVFWDGTIKNEAGMTAKLFAKLSKVFYEDVSLKLSLNITDDRLNGQVQLSSTDVLIPAGSQISPEIICTISDDFLLENTNEETFSFEIKAELSAENAHLDKTALDNAVKMTINKTLTIISMSKVKNPDWISLDRNTWKLSAAPSVSGDLNSIIDNSEYSYVNSYSGTPLWIVADFKKPETLKGAGFNISSRIWYPPTKIQILVSDNGTAWKSLGKADVPQPQGYSDYEYYLDFLIPITARYIKYEVLESSSSTKYLAEFYAFE